MSSKTYRGYCCFDLDKIKEAIYFIISEVFVSFSGLLFKQTKGIPMGGNCSPLLADLFLMYCEFKFMKVLVTEKKFHLAKLLSKTSRYIDDICLVNYRHFDGLLREIYPSDLIAERNGSDNKCVSYLDVQLSIKDSGLHTAVYHKVEDFSFPVILLTHPHSLIPYKMGLYVFAGQVMRYLRICSHIQYVAEKVTSTKLMLIDRGYLPSDLKFIMEKMLCKHLDLLLKYGIVSCKHFSNLCGFS